MRDLSQTSAPLPALVKSPATFAEAIEAIRAASDLSETRRRDLVSGLRTVARALGRAEQDVPCAPRWLQPRIKAIAPAALGLSPKTWANAVSNARAAIAHLGIVERKIHHIDDLTPAWHALWSAVLASGDRTLQPSLSRLVYFLSAAGIAPEEVRDDHVLAYRQHLEANEISRSPMVAWRAAVNGWNLAGQRVAAWPKTHLSLPSNKVVYTRDLAAFPPGFQSSFEALMRQFSAPDPFAEYGRAKPVRPATLKQYRRQLLRFASELVQAGLAIEDLTDVCQLLDPALAERGLRQMLGRNGNATSRGIAETAGLLRNLGRVLALPPAQCDALARLAKRLALPQQRGMTAKNRARLMVLNDDLAVRKILTLPDVLRAKAAKLPQGFTRGLMQEDAIALAILQVCPLRVLTLSSIRLDLHLQRPGDGRAFLVFKGEDTKTERPLQFELPAHVLRMIDGHVKTRPASLCPPGTPWLFPRRDGSGPVEANQLSSRISRRLRKETGLIMNAHLFRHFAVMLWLQANPGSYEVPRQFLGHSAVSHTINMYAGLEVDEAIRSFGDVVTATKTRGR